MNPATEIILRWHFAETGLEDEIAEELLSVLTAGSMEGEQDSIFAIKSFVEQARLAPKEAPYDEILRVALILHDEMIELDAASANLSRFQEIDKLLGTIPESQIGKRIVTARLKKLVSEIAV